MLVRIWDWYSGLPDHDNAMVQHVMRIAAYRAIFGVFAVLDREVDELHALWAGTVFPYTEPLPG